VFDLTVGGITSSTTVTSVVFSFGAGPECLCQCASALDWLGNQNEQLTEPAGIEKGGKKVIKMTNAVMPHFRRQCGRPPPHVLVYEVGTLCGRWPCSKRASPREADQGRCQGRQPQAPAG